MKLVQINKDFKCPACKNFTLQKGYGHKPLSDGTMLMWNCCCTKCDALFIDEDEYANKKSKVKEDECKKINKSC